MTLSLDVRPEDLATVRSILQRTLGSDARAWAFESRAKGRARRGSDLDLAIDAGRTLGLHDMAVLNTAFDDSDPPYAVDVVDWRSIDASFAAIIERDRVELDLDGAAPT
jgi:predicted nucleotidyltransferase